MNDDNKQAAEGPGPQVNVPTGANSAAKPGSQGDKPESGANPNPLEVEIEKLTKRNENLIQANDRLIDQRDKLSKQGIKLETKVENQKTALKGKATEIANLKEKIKAGGGRKVHQHHH